MDYDKSLVKSDIKQIMKLRKIFSLIYLLYYTVLDYTIPVAI